MTKAKGSAPGADFSSAYVPGLAVEPAPTTRDILVNLKVIGEEYRRRAVQCAELERAILAQGAKSLHPTEAALLLAKEIADYVGEGSNWFSEAHDKIWWAAEFLSGNYVRHPQSGRWAKPEELVKVTEASLARDLSAAEWAAHREAQPEDADRKAGGPPSSPPTRKKSRRR